MSRMYGRGRVLVAFLVAVLALVGIILAFQSDALAGFGMLPRTHRSLDVWRPIPLDAPFSQQIGLPLTKEGPDQATVLEVLTYTLIFTNTTNQTLNGVIITDTWTTKAQKYGWGGNLPLAEYNGNYQVSGVAVEFFTYTIRLDRRRGEATWMLEPMAPGVVGTIVFTMEIPDRLQPQGRPVEVGPSSVENSAAITTSVPGIRGGDAFVGTFVVGPVLELRKSYTTETGLSGAEHLGRIVTYTLELKNLDRADSQPATGIRISESLPSELEFLNAWAAVPGVITGYEGASRTSFWTFPPNFSLQPAATTYVSFSVRIGLNAQINKNITNYKANCKAIADGLAFPVTCVSDISVKVLAPQYKVAQTAAPPNDPIQTYPNRPITYTVYIYNPYREPVVDGSALDVLPPTFRFITMVNGPLPTSVETNTMRWDGLYIPGDGVISFTFLAWVGADTPLNINCNNKDYFNVMTTTLSGRVFRDDKMAQVWVVPQIKVSKVVQPSTQHPGENVVYTITLENRGDTAIPGPLIITDELPTYFRYVEMVSVPPPGAPITDPVKPNRIWWTDVPEIPIGGKVSFSFAARVDGVSGQTWKNAVTGYSPDTSICALETAGVKVQSALQWRKEAIPSAPTPIVQGESFAYVITWGNTSKVYAYVIDKFVDILPPGFFADGSPIYSYTITPPYLLDVDWGTYWEHSFPVTVIGEGAGTTWCDDLGKPAKQTIYQEKEKFRVHHISPWEGWGMNLEKGAPVFILPHISLGQEFSPNPAGFSQTVTVTLWLTNNMRNPPQEVTGVGVTYTLPAGFVYLGEVEGTPPPAVSGSSYTWGNITVPASGVAAIRFRVQAPFQQGDSRHVAIARSLPRPNICIPKSEGVLPVKPGIMLNKRPNPTSVGPYGLVEYILDVENQTGAPLTGVRITDTLPTGFQFIQHVSGPPPVSTFPPVWVVDLGPAGSQQGKVTIRFLARAFTLVGYWDNWVDGLHATTYITLHPRYSENVKLLVASGIGLFKTVAPTRTVAGETVVYTITFYNGSNTAIRNVRLTDTLPAGFTYAGMLNGPSPVMTSPLVWAFPGNIPNGTEVPLVFRVSTDSQLPRGFYYNRVSGYAEKAESPYDPVLVPETGDTAPVYVQGLPTVERTKAVTPTNILAGGQVTYTISLSNEDEEPHTVRLTDTLPPSVTFVSVLPPTPAPVITSPLVWDNIQVGAGTTVTLQFLAEVDYLARSGVYYNSLDATVDGRALPPLPQLAPLEVIEIPRIDVQVSIDDGLLWVAEGDLLTYTVVVTNVGEAVPIEDTVLTVTLQPSEYMTVTGAGWTEVSPDVWEYPVGVLAAGEAFSAPLYGELGMGIPSDYMTISATAEVEYRAAEPVIEENRANNRAEDIDILRGPDLVVTGLSWEPAQPVAGRPITFYATIRNQGTEGAHVRWDGSGEHWLFVVELYAKGRDFTPAGPPANVFDHIGGYCVDESCSSTRYEFLAWPKGLNAGEERTLIFRNIHLPVDTYRIYVQADVSWSGSAPWGQPFGLIREAIENNNIYDAGTVEVAVETHRLFLPLVLRNR